MHTEMNREIETNFSFFQSVVGSLMPEHAGKFVLLRQREMIGVFANAGSAMAEGHKNFSDGVFSVQRVTDRPLDLGFMSYAENNRAFS